MLTFRVDGLGAQAKIKLIEGIAGNPRPMYQAVGRVLLNRVRLCFKLGIDPWGSPWAALKIRHGQPLRDTGRLNRSITAQADRDGVTVGTNVRYARVHQFGADIVPVKAKRLVFQGPNGRMIFAKKVTVPARPFMPIRKGAVVATLPVEWSVDVVRALRRYFVDAAKKAA